MDDLFKSLNFDNILEKSSPHESHDGFQMYLFNLSTMSNEENKTSYDIGDFISYLTNITANNSIFTPHKSDEILSKPDTIVTLILSFIAFVVNMVSICATCHIPNGLTTHSKLIISLASSDILVTISVFAHLMIKTFTPSQNPLLQSSEERLPASCQFAFISSLNIMAHLISLFNLLMMAFDHYFAIMRPLRYINIMSKRNGIIIIIILWILATFGGFINFLTGIGSFSGRDSKYKNMNFCEYIVYNDFYGDYLVISCTFLCLFSIIFIYLRIYCEVKKITTRIQVLQYDEEHNSKTLITTLIIIGTFAICWIPIVTFNIVMIIQIHLDIDSVKKTFQILLLANKYLYALLLVNSICDPIIYAVRLKEVQLGYFRFLKKARELLKKKKQIRRLSRCFTSTQTTRNVYEFGEIPLEVLFPLHVQNNREDVSENLTSSKSDENEFSVMQIQAHCESII